MDIRIEQTTAPKQKPDADSLGFGKYFSDHMFVMDYSVQDGWHDARIVQYGPLSLEPSTMVLHYGQAMFEGLKAYKSKTSEVLLFRPEKNFERVNVTNERLGMPQIDEEFCLSALKTLVEIDKDWIPDGEGTSLYIRPFMIATDPFLGVRPSNTYKFIIICSPSGLYYPEGINPTKIYVEDTYVRAVRGGIGFAKTAGNYAASIKAQMLAHEKGYSQVLWLDGVEQKYVEEVGSMNIFFVIGDEVVTPELNGSILKGITRMSTIELLESLNIKVSEKKISIEEIYDAHANGALKEAFGTGTAAIIAPVGEMCWNNKKIIINDNKIGKITSTLYDTLTGIQKGLIPDTLNWITKI